LALTRRGVDVEGPVQTTGTVPSFEQLSTVKENEPLLGATNPSNSWPVSGTPFTEMRPASFWSVEASPAAAPANGANRDVKVAGWVGALLPVEGNSAMLTLAPAVKPDAV
jgi:hypothetical protein